MNKQRNAINRRSFFVLCVGALSGNPHPELLWVPCLHEYGPRTRELAYQTFSASDARDDATACHALHDIFAIPGNEMTVVDNVLLPLDKLESRLAIHLNNQCPWEFSTYVFSKDSTKTRQPHNSRTTHFIHEQTLTRKHGFAETLVLHLFDDALSRCHESIFANVPLLLACKSEGRDVSKVGRSKEELSRTSVCGGGNLTTSDEFLHGKLDGTFEGDCWRHGNHDTCWIWVN